MIRHRVPFHLVLALVAVLAWVSQDIGAQSGSAPASKTTVQQASNGDAGQTRTPQRRRMTQADREAAAARRLAGVTAGSTQTTSRVAGRANQQPPPVLDPGGIPDYFNVGNYANSPLPVLDATGAVVPGTGIRKFVDSLPGLTAANANNLGNYIPVAVKDTTTYPGSDYYQIAVSDYTQKMHTDLPVTKLRGYRDMNGVGTDAQNHYLGPLIIAKRGTPVRLKFTNALGIGAAGNLFIPVDTTIMGAGMGPDGTKYTENRAVIHLHGGYTPWISDGTPHQWITPAGDPTTLKTGASHFPVPDMPQPAVGAGWTTYFWSNDQSSSFLFYHDHSYGTTRLNVYAGVAAGYLIWDQAEEDLISGTNVTGINPALKKVIPDLGGVYHYGIPLVIQDKTFLPSTTTLAAGQRFSMNDPTWGTTAGGQLAAQDPTWDTTKWGNTVGSLWFPHVYMPNQNPMDSSGANGFGRWDYGPWFWPPVTPAAGLVNGEIVGNGTNGCPVGLRCPGTPNPSLTPEAFMDTPLVNGQAYPYVTLQPRAYRFRILNAANDRALNLQFYYADPANPTEVKMVPAVATSSFPARWPTDNRDGGVPDPTTIGPPIIQIGTESGFLPNPVVIESTPIGFEYDRRSITVLNTSTKALALGPAERADVIVDFSSVPSGSTLILYNDAPAPWPAFDSRIDYYTGNPDRTSTGGAPPTLPGYGPNTRTIMQVRIAGTPAAPFDLAALQALLPSAFLYSQPPPIVPQTANAGVAADTYANIQDTSLSVEGVTYPLQSKAIQELFELDYGRMNATLGVELPLTNFNTQTTIPLGYVDPVTETLANGKIQLWKITHNGVDTHFVHFHLTDVQVINRIGWDGSQRPPDPNEVGWKETVRMNPLEDIVVALKPIVPSNLPTTWPLQANGSRLPGSTRLADPTSPPGAMIWQTDPVTGNRSQVANALVNFGWEYVWHCHILGHEENDMMRAVAFDPTPPTGGMTLASVTPTSGPAAGGTPITIVGTNFPANAQVFVGGVAATAVTVTGGTQITATTPAGPGGLVADVVVTAPGVVAAPEMQGLTATPGAGTVTAPSAFAYVAAPAVTGISPAAGPIAGGTAATITGAAFVPTLTTVTVGGAAPISMAVTSPTTIDIVTPAGTAGAADVVVNTPGAGSATLTGGFVYMLAPTTGTVAPNTGPTTGGTLVTITGTNFVAGATTVTIGGVAATSVTVTSATSLTAVTPIGALPGAVPVAVTTPGGTGTLASGFTYTGVPTVTSILPAAGPTTGGTTVTITAVGANFVAGSSSVTIGGNAVTSLTVVNPNTVTGVTPAGVAGVATIVVNTPTSPGMILTGVAFTYVNAPTVTGLTPATGPTTGGTSVTLTGTNFVSGSTQVSFGGTAATFVSVASPTTLTVITPPGVAGNASVVVTVAGVSATAATPFAYYALAGVSGITPSGGPITGGTLVTIGGTNFVAGQTTVTIGGAAATSVTVLSATSLTCVTPPGTAGVAPVVVTTPAGGATLLTSGFTYYTVPTAASMTPRSGQTMGGTYVTITGTNFVSNATTVTFGGAAATSIVVSSPTSLTAYTPTGVAGNAVVAVTTPAGTAAVPNGFNYYTGTPSAATITSPTPGATLTGSTAVVTWNMGNGCDYYWLDVGSLRGGYDLYSGFVGISLSTTLSNLPIDGSPVWMRLYSYIAGQWVAASDVSYTAASPTLGVITSPTPGTAFSAASVTFTWNAGLGMDSYWLDVGTVQGGYDLFSKGMGTALTTTVTTLPVNGSTVWVRLYSHSAGGWGFRDYQYTAAAPQLAQISTPAAGSVLTGASVTFTWTAGKFVSGYWLDVGVSRGDYSLFSRNFASGTTTATVTGLPLNGQPVWVRLWSLVNGTWQPVDQAFTAAQPGPGQLIAPVSGTRLSSSATFSWTAGIGAAYYWLDVGTAKGGYDLYSAYQSTRLTVTVSGLPTTGGTIWARLWSYVNGGWQFVDTPFTAGSTATGYMMSPAPGSTLAGATTFQWAAVTNAAYYWLDVGTAQGGYDISSGYAPSPTLTVASIPAGLGTVWVRLYAYVNGAWQFIDISYRS